MTGKFLLNNMLTKILEIDDYSLNLAKELITNGNVVAFPTETVYGLGANALDDDAVKSIFAIKGRPSDNPLIVHVHESYDLSDLVCELPEYALELKKAYVPGPLTMVFKSKGTVSRAVSCGLDTLAIRIPAHSGAQAFLKAVDLPIAAPSANVSKHVSPVTAKHVYEDLLGKVELVLDGGKCNGGIESTVLDCTGEYPCILRSGLITKEMIELVVGRCDEYMLKDGEKVRSPGLKYKHYSPNCATTSFSVNDLDRAIEVFDQSTIYGNKVYFLCDDQTASKLGGRRCLNLGKTDIEIASNLYYKLREGEKIADLIIAIIPDRCDGIMAGVINRLTKACK